MEAIDDWSPAEKAWHALRADPKAFAQWAAQARAEWLASPAGILAKRQWEQKAKRTRVSGDE